MDEMSGLEALTPLDVSAGGRVVLCHLKLLVSIAFLYVGYHSQSTVVRLGSICAMTAFLVVVCSAWAAFAVALLGGVVSLGTENVLGVLSYGQTALLLGTSEAGDVLLVVVLLSWAWGKRSGSGTST